MTARPGDALLALALAVAAFVGSLRNSASLHPVVFDDDHGKNILFDSDPARVVETMTIRESIQQKFSATHPVFSLLTYPVVFVTKRLLSLNPHEAVRVAQAGTAALWAGTFFAVLILMGLRRLDAVLFTGLALSSAAATFWLAIPETYALGSVSILAAVGITALAERRPVRDGWLIAASAFSLSVTVTNWMAGIWATLVHRKWTRTLQISLNGLMVVIFAWAVQKLAFPASRFFLESSVPGRFIAAPEAGGPLVVLKGFLLDGVILPSIEIARGVTTWWYLPVLTVQKSAPGSAGVWGIAGVVAWSAVLLIGGWSLLRLEQAPRLRLMLGLTVLGQLVLHQLFGTETFLYALNFTPLLLLVGALGTRTAARPVTLGLAGVVTVSAFLNNSSAFRKTADFVAGRETQGFLADQARRSRPGDPFPRSTAHVVLGPPGSKESEKGYHEPGGSFSPAPGSFGIGVWITDSTGRILATSDEIPLHQIRQELDWSNPAGLPGIRTETPFYQVRWNPEGPSRWRLRFAPLEAAGLHRVVVIRSIGPAGGPIPSLGWNGTSLLVGERWSVTPSEPPLQAILGHEGDSQWKTATSGPDSWSGNDGWGYARLIAPRGGEWNVLVEGKGPSSAMQPEGTSNGVELELELPDDRFSASLRAQVAHLMMGLVGEETRPGDPLSYEGPWVNDEAHIVVALARSGRLALARRISRHLAENDFFGGFGPAADSPGLAIGALSEVGALLGDSAYDRWVWPHVRRKADFILRMRSAKAPIRVAVAGPIVAGKQGDPDLSVVSEGSRDGLIFETKGDGLLWRVNAISHQGLLDAADLAARIGEPGEAARYRAAAAEMRDAWGRATWASPGDRQLQQRQHRFSGRGWLTSQAAQGREEARRGLGIPRKAAVLAETHLGLFAGQIDSAWAVLSRFWAEQESPGLYTWSERSGIDGSYDRWEQIRGWVNRQSVTPAYEIAAQLLLFQLDMLAYVDDSGAEPSLVIGAGIPPAWLNHSMHVARFPVPGGSVDWSWDGRELRVLRRGNQMGVRLGPAFRAGTEVQIR